MKFIPCCYHFVLITSIAILMLDTVQATTATEAAAAIAQAESARQKADAVGGEWRDIGEILEKAKVAAQKGDVDSARTLAHQAEQQSKLGYQQALEQKNADFPAYLK